VLQKGTDSRNRLRTRVAPAAQVKNEPRIADRVATETGRSDVAPANEFFDFSKQMHWPPLVCFDDSAAVVFQRNSYLSRHLPIHFSIY
jgi:hypothetical protein